jgi:hypothetical protein
MFTLRRTLVAALALFVVACGGDDEPTTAPLTDETAIGTWRLRQVNGLSLPFTAAFTEQVRIQIASGQLVLAADRTYRDEQTLRIRPTGQAERDTTFVVTGTWARQGNEILVRIGSDSLAVLFVNGQLIKSESGFFYSYRK